MIRFSPLPSSNLTPDRMRRVWILLGLEILGVFLGCLSSTAATGDRVSLRVLSPHNEAIRWEFGHGFARWHEQRFGYAVEVEWRVMGGSSDSLRFVLSEFEGKPNGIGMDVLFGGGSEPYLILATRGLLESVRLPEAVMAGIPRTAPGLEVYDAGFRWYGAALSSFGILQNLEVQRWAKLPPASRWQDLAHPRLEGWVAAGDPRNSGTMNNMYEAFLQAEGWDQGWRTLARIAGNVRQFDRISTMTAKEVTLGEVAYGFAIDFYGFTQVAAAGKDKVSYVLPADFTAVSPDGIGILKGTTRRELAGRFLEYVLGEEGQKLWFLPRGHPEGARRFSIDRMVVRPDFYDRYRGMSLIEHSPFKLKEGFRYDTQVAKARRDVVAALFGSVFVDVHDELKSAWRIVIRKGMKAEDLEEFGRVPVSASEAMRLAREEWKDASLRNRYRNQWQRWALDKYRRFTDRGEGLKPGEVGRQGRQVGPDSLPSTRPENK
ncbi:MAG: ABC transporter substrate-binding protein [Verrucomicrobia bacterium]|nr:ABC transporter substrate-binding protein [Verrucomicrobiota bacterium]